MPAPVPLRVFGDPARLRDQVRRSIRRGDDLLAALDAAEHVYAERVKEDPQLLDQASDRLASIFAIGALSLDLDQTRSILTWSRAIRSRLLRGLGADGERQIRDVRLPWGPHGLPPDEFLKVQRQYVESHLEDLHRLLSRLPSGVLPATPHAAEFRDLRASGLLEEVQLNAYIKRMAAVRTRPQISAAIGAAKELVESVLVAALELLAPQATAEQKLPRLAKQVRREIDGKLRGANRALVGTAETQFSSGLVSIVQALAELRNDVGGGHGRPSLPKELAARHAYLAIDSAHAYARYIVGCLVDLRLVRLEPPVEPT